MQIFLSSIASNVLDRIVPRLRKSPLGSKVAFVPTASVPYSSAPWVDEDRNALAKAGFNVHNVDLREVRGEALFSILEHSDVICVAGGNSFYLLQEMISSGFGDYLRTKAPDWQSYIGSSAGSTILGPTLKSVEFLDDPGAASELKSLDGLGLVPFLPLVHFGNVNFREPYLKALSRAYDLTIPVVSISDNTVLLVENSKFELLSP